MTHVAHFLAEPLGLLPARRAGSIRRTSHVDMIRQDDGTLLLAGAARQGPEQAGCRAVVGPRRDLLSLDVPGTDALLGLLVGHGFRAAVDGVSVPGSLEWVLLSELPVAALLSGYGSLYTGDIPSPVSDSFLAGLPVDICAGWATPASLMVRINRDRAIPTPDGPEAPPDDGGGWHDMPELPRGALRRQRLMERTGNEVWAMFRDSYARPDGILSILHEYSVAATLDAGRHTIVECRATPRVLPWQECPQAAASAGRLVGRALGDLRAMVRQEMTGVATCTHLNDLLASLSQAAQLVQ